MPRTRSLAWAELKIGILAVAATLLAGIAIFTLGGEGGFPWERYSLKVRFPNAAGVRSGSPVRVAGVDMGRVTDLRFVGAEVELDLEINESMRERIRTTSVASLGTVSLLGEGAVDITATTDGEPVPDGGYLTYGPGPGSLATVTEQVSSGLDELTGMVSDLRAGRGTAGRLLVDDALYADLREVATSASSLMRSLQRGDGSVGRLVNDPTMARELEASMTNLSAITRRLSEGEGSLGKLLRDDEFSRTLTETTRSFETLGARLNRGEGTAGKLLTDDALYLELTALVERFDRIATGLSDGRGTAGSLLQDRELYDNLNQAAREVRGLIGEIRKDPRKYLSVKVSIF